MYLKGLLPLLLVAAALTALAATAARCTLRAHVGRVVGRLAGVMRDRVTDRLADQCAGFCERQLAETFDRNDLARLAHDLELIAEDIASEGDLHQAVVTDAIDDRADFDRLRRRLMIDIPFAGFELADNPSVHHGGARGVESCGSSTGGEDAVQVGDVHVELLREVLAQDWAIS